MEMIDTTTDDTKSQGLGGLNRRAMLMTAAVAAGAAAGVTGVLADPAPEAGFGAPLVELYVPVGVLTLEQKAAMINGVTDVVLNAIRLPPDPIRKSFVQIIEAAEGGFGVNGQVFVPHAK